MLSMLVESRRKKERSFGGTLVSVGAHGAVIVAAVLATTGRETRADPKPPRDVPVIYLDPATFEQPRSGGGTHSAGSASGSRTEVGVPLLGIGLPDPSIELAMPTVSLGPTGDDVLPTSRTGSPTGGGDQPGPMFESMVDVSARPRPGNVRPEYPRLLRESGVEGVVLAQFVIDTTGVADLATFRAIRSDHSLFERAVREAVGRMRFTSAESGGRKVPVVVQQSFAFKMRTERQ